MLMSTANARQWTTPVVAFKERNHDAVSPALLIDSDRNAKVWYLRTGSRRLPRSPRVASCSARPIRTHGVRFEQAEWSAPTTVDLLSIPGAVHWHLDVIDVPQRLPRARSPRFPRERRAARAICGSPPAPTGSTWRTFAVPTPLARHEPLSTNRLAHDVVSRNHAV